MAGKAAIEKPVAMLTRVCKGFYSRVNFQRRLSCGVCTVCVQIACISTCVRLSRHKQFYVCLMFNCMRIGLCCKFPIGMNKILFYLHNSVGILIFHLCYRTATHKTKKHIPHSPVTIYVHLSGSEVLNSFHLSQPHPHSR